MTDLHTRFQSLDALRAPDLWSEVEQRAMAMQPTRRSRAWVLIAVTLLLALAIGGVALVGSGLLKLPVTVEASPTPSSSASAAPSSTVSATSSATPDASEAPAWTATGAMLEPRYDHTATQLLDGRVLVAGGSRYDGTDFPIILASAELYDPSTGQWTATESMLGVRVGHTATLLPDGRVLVAGGGSVTDGDGGPLASAELYDPATGSWTATGSTIGAGPGRTAMLLGNGKVLVVGGSDGNYDPLAFAELYDPGTGSWSATEDMVEARSGNTATLLLGGRVLVIGGGDDSGEGGHLASAELYDPATGSWTATGSTLGVLVFRTATLLSDGTAMVTGGWAGTGASSSSAELYDPGTGQWTATGAMLEGRSFHTSTLLPDGRVLVAGGDSVSDGGGGPLASAELYDPASGSWAATASMIEPRRGHTATLLRDGRMLVAGGTVASGSLASAELYDPGRGT